jgi:hypothetical protein
MDVALYSTIWAALGLFVAAEAGKQRFWRRRAAPDWAWAASLCGATLCTLHIALAFAGRHGWSHEVAVRETARQTAAVYGISWGGGVYVNYVFVATWFFEAWWWRAYPSHYFNRGQSVTWALRAFYFLIIANAVVVFASVPGRTVGVVLVGVLLWAWRPGSGVGSPRSPAQPGSRRITKRGLTRRSLRQWSEHRADDLSCLTASAK